MWTSASPRISKEFARVSIEVCHRTGACRWPDGFVCPRCGQRRAYELANLRRWQCAGCRYQVSLTARTILRNTKTPLTRLHPCIPSALLEVLHSACAYDLWPLDLHVDQPDRLFRTSASSSSILEYGTSLQLGCVMPVIKRDIFCSTLRW